MIESSRETKEPTMKHPQDIASEELGEVDAIAIPSSMVTTKWQRLANRLEKFSGAEARGIERVDDSIRMGKNSVSDYFDMMQIWFSINLTANILTIGVLGPVSFGLGMNDAMICCLFGTIIGSAASCYISTFGPMSGNRTLVSARFTMGWWPTKLCVILAGVVILGYGLVDAIVTGLIFSAVSGGEMSTIVGIVVFSLIVWFVSAFGIKFFNFFEKYAYIPQVCALFTLVGCSVPYFDVTTASTPTGSALSGARLSYLFVCASGPLGWAPFAADYYVYHPISSNRWLVFIFTFLGFMGSKIFVEFIGIGLGCSLAANPAWAEGFTNGGVGGLIVAAYAPLGAYGNFCAVILGLGMAANMIPGNYSAAFCVQLLSSKTQKVPRVFWNTIATIVYMVCAIAGRNSLLPIFLNFLPLIGYWTIIWITMTVEEEFIFRRGKRAFDWSLWDSQKSLPIGIAALMSFLIGWAAAILCMSQAYYIGPIAKMIPADIGLPVAASWTAIVYPPLRYLELRKYGR